MFISVKLQCTDWGHLNCQSLAPKPKNLKPRGLGLTLKSYGPPTTPPHPITFKHKGGVPQLTSKSKKGSEWSTLLVQQKNRR